MMGTTKGNMGKAAVAFTASLLGVCVAASSASAAWIVDCCPVGSDYAGVVRYSYTYSYASVTAKSSHGATAYAKQDDVQIRAYAYANGAHTSVSRRGSAANHHDSAWVKGGIR
ncbi:hypothetical protein [Bifidobacterium boum]|uniref:hypothetical protein n=1 Tax=Bifidobacterium boum TaxID=78343 RepID=UPI002430C1A5|nr:hypothetical protein [Bifidobacterium boum]MCI5861849.1 hypothetical protein [Bifidobacterium boum]